MITTSPVRTRCPGGLVTAIREASAEHADWARAAELVADRLRQHQPGPEILTAAERLGDPGDYRCHVLHAEADGSFSVTAMVWRPGQITPVHDHAARWSNRCPAACRSRVLLRLRRRQADDDTWCGVFRWAQFRWDACGALCAGQSGQ